MQYTNTLTYLSSDAFSSIPSELVHDLQRMLSPNESSRPTAMDFTGSPFFRTDTRLRALRFLDHMLERDNMQKSEFLKALSDMWKDLIPVYCVTRYDVCFVMLANDSTNGSDHCRVSALVPVLSSASGETLLLLVKHSELIINKASQEHLISHVLPMIIRAYDDTDARLQEEVLKNLDLFPSNLMPSATSDLPRVHGLALRTTIAAVRVNAFLCLGEWLADLINLLSWMSCKLFSGVLLLTILLTLMCTLGVQFYFKRICCGTCSSINVPLFDCTQLNIQQFAKYMLFVKDMLQKIEEKRGVAVTGSGIPEGAVAGGTSSTSNSLEDIDPFANWPPRPSGSTGGSGISNNGTFGTPMNKMTSTSSNVGLQMSNNQPLNSRSSAGPVSLNIGNSISSTGSLNGGFEPQNSIGFQKQSQQLPASTVSYNKSTDLGSIFASNKNEQSALRLAPPPSTTVGRGRGRGRGPASTSRPSQPGHILSSHLLWICWGSLLLLLSSYQGCELLLRLYYYVMSLC
ncbi:SCY1-like protein [Arachis hypogaea]|nr:SCY1-like protein [Arachis hypogaea]